MPTNSYIKVATTSSQNEHAIAQCVVKRTQTQSHLLDCALEDNNWPSITPKKRQIHTVGYRQSPFWASNPQPCLHRMLN